MRALLVILGAMALLIGVATQSASAASGTDLERLIKRVRKFAAEGLDDQKLKGLCVCQDVSAPLNQVGILRYFGGIGTLDVRVYCYVPSFNPEGDVATLERCDIFEVLSK